MFPLFSVSFAMSLMAKRSPYFHSIISMHETLLANQLIHSSVITDISIGLVIFKLLQGFHRVAKIERKLRIGNN